MDYDHVIHTMNSCNHQFVHLVGDIVCYLFFRQRAADEIKILNISLFKFVFTQQMQHVKCRAAGGFHCEIKLYISSASMFSWGTNQRECYRDKKNRNNKSTQSGSVPTGRDFIRMLISFSYNRVKNT